ncbi:MAG: hypothetical protein M3N29_03265 [Chloroflexota bacterium]|nr:hypothetical protein [Chloroflexota bacterium]
MAKEPKVGEDEKIGQQHPEELPEHETRGDEFRDPPTGDEAADRWMEEPSVRWHEDEPPLGETGDVPPAHRPA